MKAGEFATRLAMERARMKCTQAEMAEHLEVSLRSYSSWELGKKLPHKTTRITIAKILNLPADYFLTDEELNIRTLSLNKTNNQDLQDYSLVDDPIGVRGKENVVELIGNLRERLTETNPDKEMLLKCLDTIEQSLKNADK